MAVPFQLPHLDYCEQVIMFSYCLLDHVAPECRIFSNCTESNCLFSIYNFTTTCKSNSWMFLYFIFNFMYETWLQTYSVCRCIIELSRHVLCEIARLIIRCRYTTSCGSVNCWWSLAALCVTSSSSLSLMRYVKKGKGSFYIAQYPVHWTAQSASHFLHSCMPAWLMSLLYYYSRSESVVVIKNRILLRGSLYYI